MSKIKVTGCNDCPMRFDGSMGGSFCGAAKFKDIPGTEGTKSLPDGKRANWCPLENGPVIVELKTTEKK